VRLADTRLLFLRLLETLDIDVVCDVGSMDGTDALRFRRRRPFADIIALEPNPDNFRRMQADASLDRAQIELVAAAASHFEGTAPFYLVPAPAGVEQISRRGMSSLFKRSDQRFAGPTTSTAVIRLDGLLYSRAHGRRLALWIDCEGGAFEALQGAGGISAALQLLHVEVESRPCIAHTQHLYADVSALVASWGFFELATSHSPTEMQFDALYVRSNLRTLMRLRIRMVLWQLRLRRRFIDTLGSLCPACLRGFRRRWRA
jgi:FkbM family methyltransferase